MKKLLLAALLLAPSLASAQNTKTAKPAPAPSVSNTLQTDDCARARKLGKTCELKIEEETIEGSGVTPGGVGINVRQFAVLNSLIHIRRDFVPEIVKAAEDID